MLADGINTVRRMNRLLKLISPLLTAPNAVSTRFEMVTLSIGRAGPLRPGGALIDSDRTVLAESGSCPGPIAHGALDASGRHSASDQAPNVLAYPTCPPRHGRFPPAAALRRWAWR